jgi:L-2-hydroxyglutarate oxidase
MIGMAESHGVAVIGAGIIGLASARALLEVGMRRVVVLEAEERVATHQTGHNSGVIHSGLYYRPGSLKAQNCLAGREALYRYCAERGATSAAELTRLEELRRRGEANGLADLRIMDRAELRELEPEVEAVAGMRILEAGVVDYGEVAAAFREDVERAGGEVRTRARVEAVRFSEGRHILETSAGAVWADLVVNCAGLQSDRVARLCGVDPGVAIVPFRGEYYDLSPSARGFVRSPIYPVPDPAFPFLGVHLTPTIHGTVEAGPNAVLAFKREGYGKLDFSARDLAEILTYPGFRRLAARHWRYGWSEMVRSLSKGLFVESVQRLVPRIRAQDLVPGKSGVRAQAVGRDGALLDDFHIVYGERSVHVLNAPSPAATSSLSIGTEIARRVTDRGAPVLE